MQRLAVIVGWIAVAALAVFLRFDDLGARPFHADEATGARLVADRMADTGGRGFDPTHFHGPLLRDLAVPLCRARGEQAWESMTKLSPRLVTAIAGLLLVLAPWLWRRIFGEAATLLAAALLAASPLLVYYSRMFIHEMLLTLLGVLVLAALTAGRRPLPLVAGLGIGLMHATKETFVISLFAWVVAGLLTATGVPGWRDPATLRAFVRRWWKAALVVGVAAAGTSALVYSDLLRHPRGVIDSIRTFFVYQTGGGHDKPFTWYLEMLAWPQRAAGRWWFEAPVAVFALAGFAATFVGPRIDPARRHVIRFLVLAAAIHFAVYGVIAYKTPWLACLPWAQLCLAAGFAWTAIPRSSRWPRFAATLAAALALVWLVGQARFACGRAASDARNPYAYVPTRRDVEDLAAWIVRIRAGVPPGSADSAAILGTDIWPLPWYLRGIPRVGHWVVPPPGLAETPFVFALPDAAAETARQLEGTHVALPRGLRAEVPVILFLREDLWNQWRKEGR